jgi:hypothetical protein
MLVKATSLSSDSDSSGLANDCSDPEGSSENIDGESINGTYKPRLELGKDTDVIVSLMTPMDNGGIDPLGSVDEDDSRIGKFSNQFITLLQRSFLCISRDMVNIWFQQKHRRMSLKRIYSQIHNKNETFCFVDAHTSTVRFNRSCRTSNRCYLS